jgi:hypothetical protein
MPRQDGQGFLCNIDPCRDATSSPRAGKWFINQLQSNNSDALRTAKDFDLHNGTGLDPVCEGSWSLGLGVESTEPRLRYWYLGSMRSIRDCLIIRKTQEPNSSSPSPAPCYPVQVHFSDRQFFSVFL